MPCPFLLIVSIIYCFCVGTVNSLLQQVKSITSRDSLSMDPMSMLKIPIFKPLFRNIIGTSTNLPPTSNLLPWKQSIDVNRQLSYMPMLQEQLDMIKGLDGIKEITIPDNFVYQTSKVKPAQIGNMCFANEKFRKIRMTYFDAGDNVQVFNSLFYPSFEYDLPLLGIDLISLGKGRILSVIDFQPLHPTGEYSAKYISPLTKIRQKYPDLQGTLSGKIYDDTSFFSKNMLFGRFTDESKLTSVVLPAFNEYLEAYLALMDKAVPDTRVEAMEIVKQRQTAYDEYSALKDPAVGLFDAYFGKEWSASFVHDFLFSFSTPISTAPSSSSVVSNDHSNVQASGGTPASPVHTYKINMDTGAVNPVVSGNSVNPHHHGNPQPQSPSTVTVSINHEVKSQSVGVNQDMKSRSVGVDPLVGG